MAKKYIFWAFILSYWREVVKEKKIFVGWELIVTLYLDRYSIPITQDEYLFKILLADCSQTLQKTTGLLFFLLFFLNLTVWRNCL